MDKCGQSAILSCGIFESLVKYQTINYTAFGCNNMAKFFDYLVLADRFVLKLKLYKDSRCHFSY